MNSRERDGGAGVSEPLIVVMERRTTAVVRGDVPADGLRDFFDASFGALARTLGAQRIEVLGPAFGRYHGPSGETLDLEVGFVTDRPVRPEAGVVAGSLPAGRAARLTHVGSFDGLEGSWERLRSWMREHRLTAGEDRWEAYVTKPSADMDPRELRTELYWPVVD
ncbi:GyrI-like domain-containing protein [Streptomyces sp. NPDC053493]|uniref:GyrI-like domain-containing protein n=1 Tax=Streptomyces sp. NPDC053493 TaxID=3365705 RepID=UPI0037CF505C